MGGFGPKNTRALESLARQVREGKADAWANIDDEYDPEIGRGIEYRGGQVCYVTWSAYPPRRASTPCEKRTEAFAEIMAALELEAVSDGQ